MPKDAEGIVNARRRLFFTDKLTRVLIPTLVEINVETNASMLSWFGHVLCQPNDFGFIFVEYGLLAIIVLNTSSTITLEVFSNQEINTV